MRLVFIWIFSTVYSVCIYATNVERKVILMKTCMCLFVNTSTAQHCKLKPARVINILTYAQRGAIYNAGWCSLIIHLQLCKWDSCHCYKLIRFWLRAISNQLYVLLYKHLDREHGARARRLCTVSDTDAIRRS